MRCLVRTANFLKVETWEHAFPVAQMQDKWSTPAERLVTLKCSVFYSEPFANETYHRAILALRLATDALLLELVLPTAHKQLKILHASGHCSRSRITNGLCLSSIAWLPAWRARYASSKRIETCFGFTARRLKLCTAYVDSIVGYPKKERKKERKEGVGGACWPAGVRHSSVV